MSRMLSSLVLLAAVVTLSCATSQKVYRVSNPKAAEIQGVHYALPRAVVTVDVPIKRSIFKAGKYARFSEELLGVEAKARNKVSFSLTGEPTIGTRAETDPNEVFVVKVDGGSFETREQILELTERGFLTRAKAETTSTAVDFSISTLKTAAGIAGRLIFPPGLAAGTEGLDAGEPGTAETAEELERGLRKLIDDLDKQRRIFIPDGALDPNHPETFDDLLNLLEDALGAAKLKSVRAKVTGATSGRLEVKPGQMKPGRLIPAATLRAVHSLASDPRARNVRDTVVGRLKGYTGILLELKDQDAADRVEKELADLFHPDPPFAIEAFGTVLIHKREDTLQTYGILERELALGLARDYQSLMIRRAKLITGGSQAYEATQGAIETFVKEIDEAAAEILANFTGKTTEVTWTARFESQPPSPAPAGPVATALFDLARDKGVKLSAQVLAGNPRLLNPTTATLTSFLVDSLEPTDSRNTVSLEFSYNALGQMASAIGSAATTKPVGIYYRVPARAEASISRKDTTPTPAGTNPAPLRSQVLVAERPLIPQYGVVRHLPSRSGSLKESTVDVELYEESGSIKKVTVGAEALEPDTFEDVETAYASIQDARIADRLRQEELGAEPTLAEQRAEEKLLERAGDLLLLEQEIEDLQNPVSESGAEEDESQGG